MRIPGRRGWGGGAAASEAALASGSTSVVALLAEDVVGVFSFVIVDVEELLLNVLARGAR